MAQQEQTGSGGDLLQSLQESGHNNRVSLEIDSILESNYYKCSPATTRLLVSRATA